MSHANVDKPAYPLYDKAGWRGGSAAPFEPPCGCPLPLEVAVETGGRAGPGKPGSRLISPPNLRMTKSERASALSDQSALLEKLLKRGRAQVRLLKK